MITVNKIEYFWKDTDMGNQLNCYTVAKPWMRLSTSKGDIEFPLDSDYDNDYYSKLFRKLEDLSTNTKMNISYDFREE